MISIFQEIKSIGFDIDGTFYQQNTKMDEFIRQSVAEVIFKHKPELGSLEKALELSEQMYSATGSRTKIFIDLGILNPREEMQRCISNPEIIEMISPDEKLAEILRRLHERYSMFLITSNPEELAIKKLNRLGLEQSLFDTALFGNYQKFAHKGSGNVFRYFLEQSPYLPKEHVYVGDSLKADIIPSKNAGMLAVIAGSNSKEADYCIPHIHEIESLFL